MSIKLLLLVCFHSRMGKCGAWRNYLVPTPPNISPFLCLIIGPLTFLNNIKTVDLERFERVECSVRKNRVEADRGLVSHLLRHNLGGRLKGRDKIFSLKTADDYNEICRAERNKRADGINVNKSNQRSLKSSILNFISSQLRNDVIQSNSNVVENGMHGLQVSCSILNMFDVLRWFELKRL